MRTRLYSTRGRRRQSHHVGHTGAPYFSLSVANHSDLLNLFVLLIVGMTAGRLASRQRGLEL